MDFFDFKFDSSFISGSKTLAPKFCPNPDGTYYTVAPNEECKTTPPTKPKNFGIEKTDSILIKAIKAFKVSK